LIWINTRAFAVRFHLHARVGVEHWRFDAAILILAKRWINKAHYQAYQTPPAFNRGIRSRGRAVDRWAFVSLASWIEITPPFGYAPRKILKRLRDVISGLNRTHGRYNDLTPVQKRKFKYVVRHNQFDVEGLQSLYRHIQAS